MLAPFDCNYNYVLENERVRLEPLNGNNSTQLLHFAINEPNIWTFSLVPMSGERNFKKYIADALFCKAHGTCYPFVVFDKIKQEYAGSTRFYDIQLNNNSLLIGYTWYGTKFQGTGINKNCKYLLLDFAFEIMGMERVEFRADKLNVRSIAAMMSIGCTIEGILRKNVPNVAGGRRDSIVLSIIRHEWETHLKEELKSKLEKL